MSVPFILPLVLLRVMHRLLVQRLAVGAEGVRAAAADRHVVEQVARRRLDVGSTGTRACCCKRRFRIRRGNARRLDARSLRVAERARHRGARALELDRLKADGRLRRVGPDKGGHWELLM